MKKGKVKRKKERGKLKKRMVGYSLAAGGPAAAGIVYSGPLSLDFGATHGWHDVTLEGSQTDMRLRGYSYGAGWFLAYVYGSEWLQGREVTVTSSEGDGSVGLKLASRLSESASVGPSVTGTTVNGICIYYNQYVSTGDWTQDGQTGYIGFRFDLEGGGQAYAWGLIERLDIANGRLLGWAYQNDGTAIHVGDSGSAPVPEPGGLGLLALGAAGVMGLRRKRS